MIALFVRGGNFILDGLQNDMDGVERWEDGDR